MRIRNTMLLVAALVALTASSPAGPRARAGAGASLTIYNQNLALVRMPLGRILEPGNHAVKVEGLPTNLDQESLMVANAAATLRGVRDYRTIQSPTVGPSAGLTLDLEVYSRIEELEVVFLTGGMGWSASYSMVVAPDHRSARVDGYAAIMNNSGARYDGVDVQLLAGTINRQGPVGGGYRYEAFDEVRAAAESLAQSPSLSSASFGGYHLYTVSESLDLAPAESRRIRMWGADEIETSREYVLANQFNYYQQYPEPVTQPATVRYRVERPEGTAFGDVPLPAGSVRILQPDEAGRLQLLGIAAIGNTPAERDLILSVGHAFDVVATRVQTDYERRDGRHESEWRVELSNASGQDVVVQVVESLSGDWNLMRSSHEGEKLSAGALRFDVPVPAGGEAVLEYRVSVRR